MAKRALGKENVPRSYISQKPSVYTISPRPTTLGTVSLNQITVPNRTTPNLSISSIFTHSPLTPVVDSQTRLSDGREKWELWKHMPSSPPQPGSPLFGHSSSPRPSRSFSTGSLEWACAKARGRKQEGNRVGPDIDAEAEEVVTPEISFRTSPTVVSPEFHGLVSSDHGHANPRRVLEKRLPDEDEEAAMVLLSFMRHR